MKIKRIRKVIVFVSLCILCISNFGLNSCKDENEDLYNYPEGAVIAKGDEAKPFKVTDIEGTLKFNEEEQKWVITPKYKTHPFNGGIDSYNVIYISNMTKEYETLVGEVKFSGIAKLLYTLNTGFNGAYYSLELTDISTIQTAVRSLSENPTQILNCLTPSPTPPAWFFTRSFTELNYNTSYNFRVFVHVVRPSSGTVSGLVGISRTIYL